MLPSSLPEPLLFTAGRGEPALRWGLIGPGWIAGEFVTAVQRHTRQRFTAVGSRSVERAGVFAAQHGIGHAVGSVAELVARPDVDVVYIATPPGAHLADALLAIGAGKHVLIEKPFAADAAEARAIAAAARAAGVLAMEAMWSRYLPHMSVVRRLLDDGALGEVHTVFADHGQAIPAGPEHRLYRPELGGGALLDLGIYPVQLDSMVMGEPSRVTAVGGMTSTGVDEFSTLILSHGASRQSTLSTSLRTRTPSRATIAGDEARIDFDPFFYSPGGFDLATSDHLGTSLRFDDTTGRDQFAGLSWEATALAGFVGEGRNESPLHTLDETVSILATIDEARHQLEGHSDLGG